MAISKRRNRWIADFRDRRTGKRHWITRATKREAQDALAEATQQIKAGEFQGRRDAVKFDELAQVFMDGIKASVRSATYTAYRIIIERYLLPEFGGQRLRDIELIHVERLRDRLVNSDVTTKTGRSMRIQARRINAILRTLSMLFKHALRYKWVTNNPVVLARKVRGPAAREKIEQNILNPAEIQALLAACDDRYKPLIMTAVMTGLREGELLGLDWGDVDWQSKKVHVRRQFSSLAVSEVKTHAGRRTVDLPASLVLELKRWRLRCPKGELDLVFPNSDGKHEMSGNMITRGFHPALRRAGLRRIRFHDLRHSYASMLLHSGEPITYVSQALGHASPAVTLSVYAHVLPHTDTGAAARLDRLISSAAVPGEGGSVLVANDREAATAAVQGADLQPVYGDKSLVKVDSSSLHSSHSRTKRQPPCIPVHTAALR